MDKYFLDSDGRLYVGVDPPKGYRPPRGHKTILPPPTPGHLLIEGEWRLPTPHDAEEWSALRVERDALLSNSDWTQVKDAPVDQSAWASYRQALRDLPANTDDPANPVWPTPPGA